MNNNKIFQGDVVNYLIDAGVSNEYITKKQYEVAKSNVLELLDKIRAHIADDEPHEIAKYHHYSPAGDAIGCDNYFIDFGACIGRSTSDITADNDFDIKQMIHFLNNCNIESGKGQEVIDDE